MSDEGKDVSREFDDAEVSRILERAAEQQRVAERGALVRQRGTSLAQLQEIAAEVGIDPRFVRAAALEVDVATPDRERKEILGVPRHLEDVRVTVGTIDDTQWGRIVEELRASFGSHGVVSQFGEIREWASGVSTNADSMVVRVKLEPAGDGETLIRADWNIRQLTLLPTVLAGTFASMMPVFVLLAFFTGNNDAAIYVVSGLMATLAAVSGGLGLAIGGRSADRKEKQLRSALDRVERIARSGSAT